MLSCFAFALLLLRIVRLALGSLLPAWAALLLPELLKACGADVLEIGFGHAAESMQKSVGLSSGLYEALELGPHF